MLILSFILFVAMTTPLSKNSHTPVFVNELISFQKIHIIKKEKWKKSLRQKFSFFI